MSVANITEQRNVVTLGKVRGGTLDTFTTNISTPPITCNNTFQQISNVNSMPFPYTITRYGSLVKLEFSLQILAPVGFTSPLEFYANFLNGSTRMYGRCFNNVTPYVVDPVGTAITVSYFDFFTGSDFNNLVQPASIQIEVYAKGNIGASYSNGQWFACLSTVPYTF